MAKVRVPLHAKAQGFALVDTEATKGATVGTNLLWADGTTVLEADIRNPVAGEDPEVSVSLWSRLLEIPPNVEAVAALATNGFVRRNGAVWSASAIVNADLAGANTTGLSEGTNLYHTSERVDDRVAALIVNSPTVTWVYDDVANTLTATAASGSGDVVGPAGAVNNRVVFFDGVTGKLIKDSGLTLSGSNTGDQTSIVGITGTTAQFNVALTDGDFATGGGTATGSNTGDQTLAGLGGEPSERPINTHNANYTLALTDLEETLYHTGVTAHTWTIPPNATVAFPVGCRIPGFNFSTGAITLARGAGVTLYYFDGTVTDANYTIGTGTWFELFKHSTNVWLLKGGVNVT